MDFSEISAESFLGLRAGQCGSAHEVRWGRGPGEEREAVSPAHISFLIHSC